MRRDYQSSCAGKQVKMPLTPSYWRSWRNLTALLLFVATVGCNSTNRGGQAKALDPLFRRAAGAERHAAAHG